MSILCLFFEEFADKAVVLHFARPLRAGERALREGRKAGFDEGGGPQAAGGDGHGGR